MLPEVHKLGNTGRPIISGLSSPRHKYFRPLVGFLLSYIQCQTYINTRNSKQPPTDHLIHLLELVLSLNCIEFNNKFCKQILGIRMGTCAAPSVANLCMGHLENELLQSAPVPPFLGSWKRYIDDIHFICNEGLDSLHDFQNFYGQGSLYYSLYF